jgi:hypothetical protein
MATSFSLTTKDTIDAGINDNPRVKVNNAEIPETVFARPNYFCENGNGSYATCMGV